MLFVRALGIKYPSCGMSVMDRELLKLDLLQAARWGKGNVG